MLKDVLQHTAQGETRLADHGLSLSLQEFDSDGTKRIIAHILLIVHHHPLRVRAEYSPQLILRAPRAVPNKTTDYLVGRWVEKVERSFGSFSSVSYTTGIHPHAMVGFDCFPFIFTFIDGDVFVACGIPSISYFLFWLQRDAHYSPSACSFPKLILRFLTKTSDEPTLCRVITTH